MVKEKLTFRKILERFSYGCGDFGCNIIYTAMSVYLMFYYTDYAGVSSAAVGVIMLISRVFDGVSDIIMGVIVDRTKSRFGKARPWLLRMCIPFAVSGVLLFSVPTGWSSGAKLVYVFVTYNLVSTVVYTAINVPYSALNALMTQDPYERSVLSIFRNLLATAGTLTINTFTLPLVELFGNTASAWTKAGVVTVRTLVGNFMTSIDMAGASLSILKLDEELKELLDTPCDAPALKISGPSIPVTYQDAAAVSEEAKPVSFLAQTDSAWGKMEEQSLTLHNMIYLVDQMAESIIRNEVPFCELDSHAGDGDFGMSVAKGFRQLKREWDEILAQDCADIGSFLGACSMVIMEYCGGASGPIWGSAFRAAGKYAGSRTQLTPAEFAAMMQAAVAGIQATGERSFGRGAVVGDKTLIDALVPCADTWTALAQEGKSFQACFTQAAAAAVEGADKTKEIVARMGRAGTVGERSIGYPDAGAYALGFVFTELAQKLQF